jgi:Replication initiator protein A
VFEFAHLHAKSGSLARVSDFALDIRRIAARQRLPGYRLLIERQGRTELLRILPADPSTVPVNNPVNRLGRSGAKSIGRSGAALSAEQAHPSQLNLWTERQSSAANLESNRESNSSALTHAHESRGAGAEFRGSVRNTVGSSPISTTSSAEEESAQDTCEVDRRENSKRSKR